MLPIAWSKGALRDLEGITTYIAIDNEAAAEQLRERIEQSVLPATEHPYLFRPGRRSGTREIVSHPNYIARCQLPKRRPETIWSSLRPTAT